MAQRLVEGINNHEKLSRFTYRKYEKRSPLGQLQALYNVEPTRPFLSIQIPTERRHLIHGNAVTVSADSSMKKSPHGDLSKRQKSAPIWIKVPNHDEMWESCVLSEVPKSRRVVFSHSRPHTVYSPINRSGLKSSKKAGKAGGHGRANSTLYRFQPVSVKAEYSRENIELCTALIKEQWDSGERQYLKSGVYVKGRPEAKDQELLQWFTFEGESPGALLAFTKDDYNGTPTEMSRFSIEANVGKEVAGKLLLGGTVRIGANGKLIHGTRDKVDDYTIFHEKCEEIFNMTRVGANKHEPLYPPLCWSDVEKEAKVLVGNVEDGVLQEEEVNRSVPIIYNKSPRIAPYIPADAKTDDSRLTSLLSHKSVNKKKKVETSLTYEEILESHTPDSSRKEKPRLPLPTRENSEHGQLGGVSFNRMYKSPKQPSSKLVNKSVSARIKTPCIPDEIKNGFQRQVTMPAYKVIPGTSGKVTGRPKTGQGPFERVATPTRPPKYIPVYYSGGGTTPTISQNGVEGDKSYVKLTSQFSQLATKPETPTPDNHTQHKVEAEDITQTPYRFENMRRVTNTPANISSVALIGKATPIERFHSSQPASHAISQTLSSDQSQATTTFDSCEEVSVDTKEADCASVMPSRLNINIPAVDMISASSATVNSIADFHEFDTPIIEVAEDLNNNAEHEKTNQMISNDGSSEKNVVSVEQSTPRKPPSISSYNEDPVDFSISVNIETRSALTAEPEQS